MTNLFSTERMDKKVICIAGKNNIAINIALYIKKFYKEFKLIACCNVNDDGKNTFQRSFKNFCILNDIEIVELKSLYNIKDLIFFSLEFDKIIKPELFSTQKLYNIHFSYLPEYKGMYTSALPILNGENYTGVTLHKIDAGIDTGDIIQQEKIQLKKDITAQQLYFKYIEYGTVLVKNNIKDILYDQFDSQQQNFHKSSYYSKAAIDYSDIKINLNATAFQIKNQIQAFTFPAYQLPIIFNHHIYRAEIQDQKSVGKAGKLLCDEEFCFLISTIDYNIKLFKDLRKDLFEIAEEGDIKKLLYFSKNGYDIYQRSSQGWDIAIIAAYNGKLEFLNYLLQEFDWNIDTENNNGTSLIMYLMTYCSINDKPNILHDFLKSQTPQKDQKDFFNKDITYYAKKYNNTEVIKIIKEYF